MKLNLCSDKIEQLLPQVLTAQLVIMLVSALMLDFGSTMSINTVALTAFWWRGIDSRSPTVLPDEE